MNPTTEPTTSYPAPAINTQPAPVHPALNLIRTYEGAGITVLKPRRGEPKTMDGATAQSWLAANTPWDEYGYELVVNDTRTEEAAGVIDEIADMGVHLTSTTKLFTLDVGGGRKVKYTSAERRDYGMAYQAMGEHLGAALRRPYHYLDLCHVAAIKEGSEDTAIVVGYGPNAGGPALAKSWGAKFPALLRLDVDKDGRRWLHTDVEKVNTLPHLAKFQTAGSALAPKRLLPYSLDGQAGVLAELLAAQGVDLSDPSRTGHFRACVYALQGLGKTTLAATLWAMIRRARPGARLLYVAHDNGSEALRPFWAELLRAGGAQ